METQFDTRKHTTVVATKECIIYCTPVHFNMKIESFSLQKQDIDSLGDF